MIVLKFSLTAAWSTSIVGRHFVYFLHQSGRSLTSEGKKIGFCYLSLTNIAHFVLFLTDKILFFFSFLERFLFSGSGVFRLLRVPALMSNFYKLALCPKDVGRIAKRRASQRALKNVFQKPCFGFN